MLYCIWCNIHQVTLFSVSIFISLILLNILAFLDFRKTLRVHGEYCQASDASYVTGYGKMRNAEYRCGVGIGLELGSGIRVRVMARAWVRVRFRVVFCSNIVQFLTILHIPIAQMRNMAVRLGIRVSG